MVSFFGSAVVRPLRLLRSRVRLGEDRLESELKYSVRVTERPSCQGAPSPWDWR
jgi:hypothetical protein